MLLNIPEMYRFIMTAYKNIVVYFVCWQKYIKTAVLHSRFLLE